MANTDLVFIKKWMNLKGLWQQMEILDIVGIPGPDDDIWSVCVWIAKL